MLSEEEKQRIEEEERFRREVREKLDQEAAQAKAKAEQNPGCCGCLSLILLAALVGWCTRF